MSDLVSGLGGLAGPFWPTLIGAVVGAVVGGVISYFIQASGARAIRNERLAAKRQEDLANASLVATKMIRMLVFIRTMCGGAERGSSLLIEARSPTGRLWFYFLPFATEIPRIQFDKDEAAFLFSTGHIDVFQGALELADLYDSLAQMASVYSRDRANILAQYPPTMTASGAGAFWDEDTQRKMEPLAGQLEALARQFAQEATRGRGKAEKVLHILLPYCENRFRGDFPKFNLGPGAPKPQTKAKPEATTDSLHRC